MNIYLICIIILQGRQDREFSFPHFEDELTENLPGVT